MKNLSKAVLAVMAEVKGIDKTMTIGTGQNSYKGIPDQEVKKVIGESMQRNGLCILQIGVTPTTKIERWEETSQYGNNPPQTKMKQSVFTEATTRYLLLHESGESIELAGLGHGVDSQDKGAGKATTYALKYVLLYTFLVPTGKIDDTDNDHSDSKEVPQKKEVIKQALQKKDLVLPWLNKNTKEFDGAVKKLIAGTTTIDKIRSVMQVSRETEIELTYQLDIAKKADKETENS